MKLRNIFLIIFILSLFSGIILSYNHTTNVIPNNFEDKVEKYLNSNIQSKTERINDNINEIENDILFLSNSPRIKNMLKEELENSDRAAKLMVDSKIDIFSKEVENYLLKNSEMTLKDLQKSREFNNIAVQEFGINGYSLILGSSSEIIYFHKNLMLIGTNAKEVSNPDIGTYLLFNESIHKGSSSGYYDWLDEDGDIRRKYGNFKKINIKTKDDISLIIETTAYVDDFFVIKNLSKKDDKFLKEFGEANNYKNILLFDKVGHITYMTDESLDFGLNLKLVEGGIYKDILTIIEKDRSNEALFKGLFLIDNDAFISFSMSIYDDEEFLGIISIHEEMSDIAKILKSSISLGETEDSYIIDEDKILITPLNDGRITPFVQEVNTEGAISCSDDHSSARERNITAKEYQIFEIESGSEESFIYLDYKGDYVIGKHFPIEKTEWCLFSEIEIEEVLNIPKKTDIKREFILQGIVFSLSIIIFILFYFKIDKKYYVKKKKKLGNKNE